MCWIHLQTSLSFTAELISLIPVSPFSHLSSLPDWLILLNHCFYHVSSEHFNSPLIPTTSSLNYFACLSKTFTTLTFPYPTSFPTISNINCPLQSGRSHSPRKIAYSWLPPGPHTCCSPQLQSLSSSSASLKPVTPSSFHKAYLHRFGPHQFLTFGHSGMVIPYMGLTDILLSIFII